MYTRRKFFFGTPLEQCTFIPKICESLTRIYGAYSTLSNKCAGWNKVKVCTLESSAKIGNFGNLELQCRDPGCFKVHIKSEMTKVSIFQLNNSQYKFEHQ